jgi:hypothetical protein
MTASSTPASANLMISSIGPFGMKFLGALCSEVNPLMGASESPFPSSSSRSNMLDSSGATGCIASTESTESAS